MATPKKLKSGNWRVQVPSHKVNGKWKYKSFTASTKAEASLLASEFQTGSRDRRENRIRVEECIDRYIDSRRGVLSPSSIRGYQHDKKYLKPLGDIYVPDLTSADVQYWISNFSKDFNIGVKTFCKIRVGRN